MRIQLQDKYQTLEFKAAGCPQYQRFRGTEQSWLMLSIFKREFNVETLIEGGVVYEHFMLHSSKRLELGSSINRHGKKLFFSLMSLSESFLDNFEPINLIADYYGEKYALYLAFFFHHMAWLIYPSIFGTLLFAYQIYLGFVQQEEG